jgi:hypothetical protein
MPHDQPYLQAEKKIEQVLKSGATELDISHSFIRAFIREFVDGIVENKGGNHDA